MIANCVCSKKEIPDSSLDTPPILILLLSRYVRSMVRSSGRAAVARGSVGGARQRNAQAAAHLRAGANLCSENAEGTPFGLYEM